jgi:micrococcal nuclease
MIGRGIRPPPTNFGPRRTRSVPAYYVIFGVIAFVFLVTGIPYLIASDDAQRPALEEVRTPLTLPPNTNLADLKEARVIQVIDGDTINVDLEGKLARIRYFGINTPERGDRCYREATDRNETLIGSRVLLLPDARDQDGNGRLLRYVFLSDGTSVDATLVAEGFAQAWREDGRYKDQLLSIEDQARDASRGCLWR